MRRRGIGRGPGLVGVAARTAVVAGTATAVVNHSANKQAAKADAAYNAQQLDDMQRQAEIDAAVQQAMAQQAPPPPPQYAPAPAPAPAAAPAGNDTIEQLQQLAAMKQQGLLSDEEFAAAKAQLLGG